MNALIYKISLLVAMVNLIFSFSNGLQLQTIIERSAIVFVACLFIIALMLRLVSWVLTKVPRASVEEEESELGHEQA